MSQKAEKQIPKDEDIYALQEETPMPAPPVTPAFPASPVTLVRQTNPAQTSSKRNFIIGTILAGVVLAGIVGWWVHSLVSKEKGTVGTGKDSGNKKIPKEALSLAVAAYEAKDYETARNLCDEILKRNGEDKQADELKNKCWLGAAEMAVDAARRNGDREKLGDALINMGFYLQQCHENNKALQAFEESRSINDSPTTRVMIARTLKEMGQRDKAAENFLAGAKMMWSVGDKTFALTWSKEALDVAVSSKLRDQVQVFIKSVRSGSQPDDE